MEPKFRPRIPDRGARGKTRPPAKVKSEKDDTPAPSPVPPTVHSPAPIDLDSNDVKMPVAAIKEDPIEVVDLKPESMDFTFDNDVKVKIEGDNLVWEGVEEVKQEDTEMKISDGDDRVVREIDVCLTPIVDSETKFYLLQYPLRPYWRPYDLEERCQEVRVKHQHNKLEVDLVVDNFGDNYDQGADDHLKITKQTLTSTQGNLSTSYTIGLLQGNKLHLNPLHAIVQLRPSLKYLNEADEKKKKNITHMDSDDEMAEAEEENSEEKPPEPVALKVEVKKQETERQQQSRLMSYAHLKQLEEAEPWIALEPHGFDSPITEEIRTKMKSSGNNLMDFSMHPNDYMRKLVPGRATSTPAPPHALVGQPLSKSYLDSLPLEKRLQTVLSQGGAHVLQFDRLMKLVPRECTEEEVLEALQKTAYLVQGCWVATSKMRYTGGPKCVLRDYILLQFVKNRVISRETLEELNVPKEMLRDVLLPLAVQNIRTGAWEFAEATDKTFVKRHSIIAKNQLQRWTSAETMIKNMALNVQNMASSGKKSMVSTPTSNPGNIVTKTSSSMAPETMAALPDALREIFLKHHVCNLQFICSCLRENAIKKSQADAPVQEKACAVAAAKGASAPPAELAAIVETVATCVNGVYFLTELGDPSVDPFREVVIALLKQKSSGLQKSEIMEAFKLALKKAPPNPVYQKVMKEFCYTRGATWVLKTGDGRPL